MAVVSREFPLDPAILGAGSAVGLSVGGTTDAATLSAIASNAPFPAAVDLARVGVEASTGKGIVLRAGEADATFRGAAKVESGIQVFDSPADAVTSLAIEAAERFDPRLSTTPGQRWAVMRWSYDVQGAVSGSHPIGVVGAATLTVEGTRDALFAVVHRFDAAAGARDVLSATVRSWRLPRHVGLDRGDLNLSPSTWLVAEADGSLAVTLGARLGYDVSFTHESRLLGLTRDLGATLDANLKTAVGLTVSGRYLIVIGRENPEAASRVVRLRLFKESRKGLRAGLNLNVGVRGSVPLPDNFDEFVRTVFGLHGPQVLKDLRALEQWADPSSDLVHTTARLTTRAGLDLLHRATGFDLPAKFLEARTAVVDALDRWDRLPDRVSAMLWKVLATRGDDGIERLRKVLQRLASGDPAERREAILVALRESPIGDNPQTEWLEAVAERGLLALTQDLDRVSEIARETLAIIEGGVVGRLQRYVESRLDLTALRKAAVDGDFAALDEWLVRRLADLLNKADLPVEDLRQVQRAVHAVDRKVRTLYEQGMKALSSRHAAEVAGAYERSRADTALLDVSFDLASPPALARFRRVVEDGDLDDLIVTPTEGVTLHAATLTHGIRRDARIEVRLPFVTAETTRIAESLASVSIEEQGGRILVYEFDASEKVTSSNRARSELSVLGRLEADAPRSAMRATGTIGYEERQVRRRTTAGELERVTRPFLDAYLAALFDGGEPSVRAFYDELAAAVAGSSGGAEKRTDAVVSMQVAYPAHVLRAWLQPRDEAELHHDAMRLSLAVQSSVRRLIPSTFSADPDRLRMNEPVAALLVWASMPLSTSIDTGKARVRFNTDRQAFWDYTSRANRRAVARDGHTAAALRTRLAAAHARLAEEGRSDAGQFEPARAGRFVDLALADGGDVYLSSLLNAEALMIDGAIGALGAVATAISRSGQTPSAAVRALAEFAGALVETFGARLQFVYTREATAMLGPMILAEASAAIHPGSGSAAPSAALRLFVLRPGHPFSFEQFLKGELPPTDNVAAAQTLVRV